MLHKCGKKIETISQKIPTFVEVTGDKLVGGLFSGGGRGGGLGLGGGEFIQNFDKGEIDLIGENFVGNKISLGNIFAN